MRSASRDELGEGMGFGDKRTWIAVDMRPCRRSVCAPLVLEEGFRVRDDK